MGIRYSAGKWQGPRLPGHLFRTVLTLAFLHYPPPSPVVHYPFFAIPFLFRLSGKSSPCVSSSDPYFTIVYSITLVTKARRGSDTLEKPFTFQPVNLSNALAGPEADVNASGDCGHEVELEYPRYGASPNLLAASTLSNKSASLQRQYTLPMDRHIPGNSSVSKTTGPKKSC